MEQEPAARNPFVEAAIFSATEIALSFHHHQKMVTHRGDAQGNKEATRKKPELPLAIFIFSS